MLPSFLSKMISPQPSPTLFDVLRPYLKPIYTTSEYLWNQLQHISHQYNLDSILKFLPQSLQSKLTTFLFYFTIILAFMCAFFILPLYVLAPHLPIFNNANNTKSSRKYHHGANIDDLNPIYQKPTKSTLLSPPIPPINNLGHITQHCPLLSSNIPVNQKRHFYETDSTSSSTSSTTPTLQTNQRTRDINNQFPSNRASTHFPYDSDKTHYDSYVGTHPRHNNNNSSQPLFHSQFPYEKLSNDEKRSIFNPLSWFQSTNSTQTTSNNNTSTDDIDMDDGVFGVLGPKKSHHIENDDLDDEKADSVLKRSSNRKVDKVRNSDHDHSYNQRNRNNFEAKNNNHDDDDEYAFRTLRDIQNDHNIHHYDAAFDNFSGRSYGSSTLGSNDLNASRNIPVFQQYVCDDDEEIVNDVNGEFFYETNGVTSPQNNGDYPIDDFDENDQNNNEYESDQVNHDRFVPVYFHDHNVANIDLLDEGEFRQTDTDAYWAEHEQDEYDTTINDNTLDDSPINFSQLQQANQNKVVQVMQVQSSNNNNNTCPNDANEFTTNHSTSQSPSTHSPQMQSNPSRQIRHQPLPAPYGRKYANLEKTVDDEELSNDIVSNDSNHNNGNNNHDDDRNNQRNTSNSPPKSTELTENASQHSQSPVHVTFSNPIVTDEILQDQPPVVISTNIPTNDSPLQHSTHDVNEKPTITTQSLHHQRSQSPSAVDFAAANTIHPKKLKQINSTQNSPPVLKSHYLTTEPVISNDDDSDEINNTIHQQNDQNNNNQPRHNKFFTNKNNNKMNNFLYSHHDDKKQEDNELLSSGLGKINHYDDVFRGDNINPQQFSSSPFYPAHLTDEQIRDSIVKTVLKSNKNLHMNESNQTDKLPPEDTPDDHHISSFNRNEFGYQPFLSPITRAHQQLVKKNHNQQTNDNNNNPGLRNIGLPLLTRFTGRKPAE